jgi:general secretion pathway protein I
MRAIRAWAAAALGAVRGRRAARAGAARGFTLLEVLIAFVIAALALGAMARSGASSLDSIRIAARYEEALARARSRLAVAVHGNALTPGDLEGDDGGGYRWRVRITPVATTAGRAAAGPRRLLRVPVTLYAVTVWVWWGEGEMSRREVRLDTQHVGAAAP